LPYCPIPLATRRTLAVARDDANRGVYQLMGEDGYDLHRQQSLDSLRSGRNEISKW